MECRQRMEGSLGSIGFSIENSCRAECEVVARFHSDEFHVLEIAAFIRSRRPAGRQHAAACNGPVLIAVAAAVRGLGRKDPEIPAQTDHYESSTADTANV